MCELIGLYGVPLSVPQLPVVKEMIRRLQELRHTEQVQRAYALNCGEGATVSYELQLRVLREFGLADGATELLQVRGKQGLEEGWGLMGVMNVDNLGLKLLGVVLSLPD